MTVLELSCEILHTREEQITESGKNSLTYPTGQLVFFTKHICVCMFIRIAFCVLHLLVTALVMSITYFI